MSLRTERWRAGVDMVHKVVSRSLAVMRMRAASASCAWRLQTRRVYAHVGRYSGLKLLPQWVGRFVKTAGKLNNLVVIYLLLICIKMQQ